MKHFMKHFNILLLSLFLIGFFSCTKDDDNDIQEVNDVQVKFSSGINSTNLKVSGTEGDQWEGNETIGIYMVNHGMKTIAERAENILYATTSTGTRTTFTSANPIYYPKLNTQIVDFIAYHPYNSSVRDFVYRVNVANQSNLSAIDLMTAKADNTGLGYDRNDPSPVNLKFTHQLSKLVLNVKEGNGVAIPTKDDLAVSIEGMDTIANFDLYSGRLMPISYKAGPIVPQSVTNNTGYYTYEAILLPVKALNTSHIVKFKIDGSTYEWKIKPNNSLSIHSLRSFDAGRKYTFNVTLQNKAVEVTGTITPWDGYTEDVIAIVD